MARAAREERSGEDQPQRVRARFTQVKGERLDLRITPDAKAMIEQAAALSGLPVSAFVLNATVQRARQLIHESQQLTLSNRDRDRFFAALDDEDAQPNAALLRAAEKFKAATG